ncbi:MAG: antirepresssor protein RebB [Fluviicola sp.]|jgi:hypothetical protein|uniref:RebB family R body protein n=1 Tax=Fluviicola sp. TaxID=1917219 RepID=UPI00262E8212|nr:RebB family R body protein [Fluviicola sp.]MDF3026619.1 antirepresssor protein RebB [Fluviicola sp.]
MADIVNPQITDAVTQTNVKVLAEAPAMAMGTLYQTMAHSLGILMENAVTSQQNMNVIGQASVTQGVAMIYSVDTASTGVATKEILDSK